MLHWIIYALFIFFIARFIGRVVLPMFHITSAATNKVRDMQRQMEEMQRRNAQEQQKQEQRQQQVKEGDYIDYEEVK